MKAVIMAGGRGSRLKPLTVGCPKPMVSFINKPVLDHVLHLLKHHQINEVIITVQHLANQIQNYLKAMTDAAAGKVNHIAFELVNNQHRPNNNHYLNYNPKEQPMPALLKNQKIFPVYWVILALVVLACDYALGPFIQFPFLFILPVVLASWYNGRWWGFAFALGLPLIRLYFSSILWDVPWTMLEVGINAVIRISVLLLIAYLVDRAAIQNRTLTHEVQVLTGLLPICSFCKKIRNEDNTWERLELYISNHSEAQFSHGVCPECAREHYPEFFKG